MTNTATNTLKVAVILAGSGYLDGAEIRESVLTLLALENKGTQTQLEYQIFAPNIDQHHVVNHLTGEEVANDSRNVLVESARIARGNITDLADLNPANFDSLVMPGGFGVAKNLSSFAFEGSAGKANELLTQVVQAFHQASKPIGAICIAPAILALTLGEHNPKITIGTDTATATELEKLGATHINCATNDCVVDSVNKLVTTPAYMDDNADLVTIFAGISKLVDELVDKLVNL